MKKINTLCLTLPIVLILVACGEAEGIRARDEYLLYVNGVEIEVGGDADEVISRLGEPNRIAIAPSCAGLGLDEAYIYNGFRINVYRDDEDCEIVSVELTNDTVKTGEGIGIGSSEASVRKAYGEGRNFSGGVEYAGDDVRLCFFISEGRVIGIKYQKKGG